MIVQRIAASLLTLGVAVSLLSAGSLVVAQDTKPAAPKADDLTPEELKERDLRKDCKVRICSAFHVRKPDGGDIACNVLKSWRKAHLNKVVEKAKVSWPWGGVRCVANIKLKRADLIKAMTDDRHEA